MNKVRVEGDLIENAQSLIYADGTAVALLQIGQPGGIPIMVERCFGNSDSARFTCHKAAQQMRKGMHIVTHGLSLRPSKHKGQSVIRLDGVDHVEHERVDHHMTQGEACAA